MSAKKVSITAELKSKIREAQKQRDENVKAISDVIRKVATSLPEVTISVIAAELHGEGYAKVSAPANSVQVKPTLRPNNVADDKAVLSDLAEKALETLGKEVEAIEEEASLKRAESMRTEKLKKKAEQEALAESIETLPKGLHPTKGPKRMRRPQGVVERMMSDVDREALWSGTIVSNFLNALTAGLIKDPSQLRNEEILTFGRHRDKKRHAFDCVDSKGKLKMGYIDEMFIQLEFMIDEFGGLYVNGEPWFWEDNINDGQPIIKIPGNTKVIGGRRASVGFTVWLDRRVMRSDSEGKNYLGAVRDQGKIFAEYVRHYAWKGRPDDKFLSDKLKKFWGGDDVDRTLIQLRISDVLRINTLGINENSNYTLSKPSNIAIVASEKRKSKSEYIDIITKDIKTLPKGITHPLTDGSITGLGHKRVDIAPRITVNHSAMNNSIINQTIADDAFNMALNMMNRHGMSDK